MFISCIYFIKWPKKIALGSNSLPKDLIFTEQFKPWEKWNMSTANPSDNIKQLFFSTGNLVLKLGVLTA